MNKLPGVIAIYLPQFHRTIDNDRWWGDGFTDWETVRTAKPCFDNHIQPRIPLGNEYYDLLKKETMQRQVELANKSGIDGFCFYHYYFANGKMELETPAENFLKWKEIEFPFCFNWASEPWIRSWSRIPGNVWAEKYDSVGENHHSGVLIAQDYGDEKDWERHFYYLLPFFKDERYMKMDRKPLFVFYSPDDIRCLRPMTVLWRQLAEKEGLEGLYLIGARMNGYNDCLDAALVYEPRHAINALNCSEKVYVKNGVRCYEYKDIWEACLSADGIRGMKTYFSGVVDYDDTPRRGYSGECFLNVTPKGFEDGLVRLLFKSMMNNNEYVFINAWNEWGEGMYLEPDKENESEMLNAIKNAKERIISDNCAEFTMETNSFKGGAVDMGGDGRKFKELFEIVDRWLFLEQDDKVNLRKFLSNKGYASFAIYGMSSIGKHLLLQARKEGIEPEFGIDRYVGQFGDDFKIYRPEERFPNVDCIIVTAYDYEFIKKKIEKRVTCDIAYIGDVIYSMQIQ